VEANKNESERLEKDLIVVMDKVRLCREMLLVSRGIDHDEALADVIGFLEACKDRLINVIEAGSQGLLSETQFELVFQVNDAVSRTLDAERVFLYYNYYYYYCNFCFFILLLLLFMISYF
jgi:hypothetical protein